MPYLDRGVTSPVQLPTLKAGPCNSLYASCKQSRGSCVFQSALRPMQCRQGIRGTCDTHTLEVDWSLPVLCPVEDGQVIQGLLLILQAWCIQCSGTSKHPQPLWVLQTLSRCLYNPCTGQYSTLAKSNMTLWLDSSLADAKVPHEASIPLNRRWKP